ncbi:hypothetical protein M409DRAFT_67503 [Zasmidium cellare ATCC 36951]|uniref:Autophagy-related protein 14 n=1 Tax=Zasmidium cellare ATCC 36951 TaxID=1080233 RepID=A0A6A6CDV7_ZASCE|nr:uncharacterized protein M409DRAFT_67503 [Zasmidium cellare ATCC 36951]KAF2165261.1 hypothetical protein M409DRAFT_67503 [Zasmidium cellare ATCC 36951]
MAQPTSPTSSWTFNRAEGPWLLSYNRKLRNLVSISLRNLNLTPTSPFRKRGKTIDDDALPNTLNSPAKLVALREQKALGISRSSTDLRAVAENAVSEAEDVESTITGGANGSPKSGKERQRRQSATAARPRRPEFRKLRRRSTLEWAQSTPQKRQERLEKTTKERMADVFFTLHIHGVEEPVYVSEIIQKTMNPTFRHVDWSHCGPGVTRLDQITVHVWVKGGKFDEWRQLLQLELQLTGLQYVGKSLDDLDRLLPQNTVLFHLSDGIYTSFSDSLADFTPLHPFSLQRSDVSSQRTLPTSSFDALLRLSKLDDSIQDALATRNQIANDLEDLLQRNKESLLEQDEVAEARDRLKTIEFAKRTVEKQLDKAQKQQEEKRGSLAARRKLMQSDAFAREAQTQEMQDQRPKFPEMRQEDSARKKDVQNQRRRICEDLQYCYPIQPLAGKTLAFTIRDLHLPNSEDLDSETPETISAALGFVAHVLQMLAFYLKQALPYPVSPLGSVSTVYDTISILKSNTTFPSRKGDETTLRTYPLFTKGVPRFRFEYAVFLINQDIRVLLENAFNLKVLDIRQTLPNLKYLLYVATAGEGDLPARKAGGVRGLMRMPVMERVGSTESFSSGMSGNTLLENGKPKGAVERLRQISGGKNKEGMKVR